MNSGKNDKDLMISDSELTNVFNFENKDIVDDDSPTINMPISSSEVTNEKVSNSENDDYSSFYKKKRKKDLTIRIVSGIVAGIIGLAVGGIAIAAYITNHLLNHSLTRDTAVYTSPEITIINDNGDVEVVTTNSSTSETKFSYVQDESIHNYLLIGIDSRTSSYSSTGKGGLADVIMVMSVDTSEGTIKMFSIARDSYAYVPGYSKPMKINAAMSLGGPEVLKQTVENQLRLSIDGYAYVNFYKMANVIDAVGGVYVDLTSSELNSEGGLNWNLAEVNTLSGLDPDYQAVTNYGYGTWLNGRQAVAYARIRKIDSDYMRSERQVEVLRSLLDQYMKLDNVKKLGALDDILSLIVVDPDITNDEITSLAIDFLPSMKDVKIEYMQLPIKGCFYSGMYGGEWSIRPNWNGMIPYIQEFLFDEMSDFDPVDDIPNSPQISNCPTDISIEELLK